MQVIFLTKNSDDQKDYDDYAFLIYQEQNEESD